MNQNLIQEIKFLAKTFSTKPRGCFSTSEIALPLTYDIFLTQKDVALNHEMDFVCTSRKSV